MASTTENEKFDFIIVGGGTAGLVLANRLTLDPDISVLVLEAGADRLTDPKITIPGLATLMYEDPDYDWAFATTPQVLTSYSSWLVLFFFWTLMKLTFYVRKGAAVWKTSQSFTRKSRWRLQCHQSASFDFPS